MLPMILADLKLSPASAFNGPEAAPAEEQPRSFTSSSKSAVTTDLRKSSSGMNVNHVGAGNPSLSRYLNHGVEGNVPSFGLSYVFDISVQRGLIAMARLVGP